MRRVSGVTLQDVCIFLDVQKDAYILSSKPFEKSHVMIIQDFYLD